MPRLASPSLDLHSNYSNLFPWRGSTHVHGCYAPSLCEETKAPVLCVQHAQHSLNPNPPT
eukprot:354239-Chlamydomonas_euryale.AAC.6